MAQRRLFTRIAGISGALAVVAATYGSHGFPAEEDQPVKLLWEVANKQHFFHTLALLGVHRSRYPRVSAGLFVSGMVLFSGSIYYRAITFSGPIKNAAPAGGILLILGWLSLAI